MINRLLQSFAVWYGIGIALHRVGLTLHDMLFWCILVLMIISSYLERSAGREEGILLNGAAVLNLSDQVNELKSKLAEYEAKENG